MHQREIHREHDPIGEGADGAVFQMSDGSVVKIGDVLTSESIHYPMCITKWRNEKSKSQSRG
jgi:hypothetical protein